MDRVIRHFANYELEYLFQPGQWMSQAEQRILKMELDLVNRVSGHGLNYGIFDPSIDERSIADFFSKSNFCMMRMNGELTGFFYNMILAEKPIPAIHAGLVMIAKNKGVDLLRVPYAYMAILQRQKYGSYFYTNISSTPSIIGTFSDLFSDVWPNYRGNLVKPPNKKYVHVLNLLAKEYINKYFPKDQIEICPKRFVMKSPQKEMGFEQDPRKLSRYHNLQANLFCIYWLDYTKGEDIVQVGRVDLKFVLRLRTQLFLLAIREGISRLFSRSVPAKAEPGEVVQAAQAGKVVPIKRVQENPENQTNQEKQRYKNAA